MICNSNVGIQSNLFEACRAGDLSLCREILSQGASVHAADMDGDRPIHWGSEASNIEIVQLFLDEGALVNASGSDNVTALHKAAWKKNIPMVDLLIKNGADVNATSYVEAMTVLMCAVLSNNTEMIRALVVAGANPNHADSTGDTALHYAAMNGLDESVMTLIEMGADTSIIGNELTPMMAAVDQKKASCLGILMNVSSEKNIQDTRDFCVKSGLNDMLAIFQAREAKIAIERISSFPSSLAQLI